MPSNWIQTPPPVPDTAESGTGNPTLTSTPSFRIIDGSNTVTLTLNAHRYPSLATSVADLASTGASVRPSDSFAGSRNTAQNPATNVRRPAASTVSPAGGTLSTSLSGATPSTNSSPAISGNSITGIRSIAQDGDTPIRPAAANTGSPSINTQNADRGIGIQETSPTTRGAAAAPQIISRTLYSVCEPYYTTPAPKGGRSGINSADYPRREPTEEEAALARLTALIPQLPAQEVCTFADSAFGRCSASVGPAGTNITDFPASRHQRDPVGMFRNAPNMHRLAAMWQGLPQQCGPSQDGGFSHYSRTVQPPGPSIPFRGPEMGYYPAGRNAPWPGGFPGPPRGNHSHAGPGVPRPSPGFVTMINPPLNFYGFPYAPGATLSAVPTRQTVNPPSSFYGFRYAPGVTQGAATVYQAHAPTRGEPTRRPPATGRPGDPTPTDTTVAPPPAYTYSGTFPLAINFHPASRTLTVTVTATDTNASLTYDDFMHTISARIQLPRFWIQPQGGFVVRFKVDAARRLVWNEELPTVDVWDVDAMELNLLAVGREEWERQLEAWRAKGMGRWPMGISRWDEEDAE